MNPFIKNHKLRVVEVHSEQKYANTSDIQEGIVLTYKKETTVFYVEEQEKTSVYEIPYIENVLFGQLSSKGRDLLLYIFYNIKKEEDSINLRLEKTCREMRISKPTLLKSIKELIEISLICRKDQSVYWINPLYLFKGNRMRYYKSQCEDCIEVATIVNKS